MNVRTMFFLLAICASSSCQAQLIPLQSQAGVLVECLSDNRTNMGSGFFLECSNHMFLVTARHVLFDVSKLPKFELHSTNCLLTYGNNSEDPTARHIRVDLGGALARNEIRAHRSRDVAAIHLFDVETNLTAFRALPFVNL